MAKKEGNTSEIKFSVGLDENHVPENIEWEATNMKEDGKKPCKAIMIAVWDQESQETLKIDLWTKEMPIDEMKIFFHQTLGSMADTFQKSTGEEAIAEDLRDYCAHFAEKMEVLAP